MAPLHLFVDMPQILGEAHSTERSETLSFVEELTTTSNIILPQTDSDVTMSNEDDDEDDVETPPGTPRASQRYHQRREEREREEERRRLERLVLEDLDLGYDYSQSTMRTNTAQAGAGNKTHTRRRVCSLIVTQSDGILMIQ